MSKFITLIVAFVLLFFSSCKQTKESEKIDVEVSFTKNNKLDYPFVGHGIQWSAYPHADSHNAEWGYLMTNEKWEELYKRLDFISPHIIRVMDVATWRYYKGLDKNGQPVLDFNTQEVKTLYKLLNYCQERNIPVLFGEWGAPGLWNLNEDEKEIERADDPRWSKMIVKYLQDLIVEKGYTCIKYYNLVNEPNGYWASTNGDWEQWKSGYLILNKALKESGLDAYVSLAGPDAVTQWDHPTHPKKAHDWVYETVGELNSETGLYDFHIYADQNLIRDGSFESYLKPFSEKINETGKPFVLGELGMKYDGELRELNRKRGEEDSFAGPDDSSMFVYDFFYGVDMADAAIQSMLAGVGGAIAWDLDDAMHTVGDLGEKHQLKKWGMWNILSEDFGDLEEDKKPRPWSYTWTLLCRLFPSESNIYKPSYTVENDSLRSVVATHGKEFTAAFVNQNSSTKRIKLNTTLLKRPRQLYLYEYSELDRPVNKDGFPVVTKELKTNLMTDELELSVKGNSVVFISTILIK